MKKETISFGGREIVLTEIEPDEAMREVVEEAARHVRETMHDPHVHVDIVYRGRHGSTSAMTAAEVGRVVEVVAEQFRGGRPDPRTEATRWVVDLLDPYPGNVDGYRHQLADIAVYLACTDPEHGADNRAKLGIGDCGLALLEDRGRWHCFVRPVGDDLIEYIVGHLVRRDLPDEERI